MLLSETQTENKVDDGMEKAEATDIVEVTNPASPQRKQAKKPAASK